LLGGDGFGLRCLETLVFSWQCRKSQEATRPLTGRFHSAWRDVIDCRTFVHEQSGMPAVSAELHEHERLAEPVGVSGFRSAAGGRSTDEGSWASPRLVAQLIAQHSRFVWCLLRRLGVEVSYLDDATQHVFIVAARRLGDVPEGRDRAFLCGISVRVASNYRRAANNHGARRAEAAVDELQSATPNGESLLEQMQARRMLDAVLDSMTEDLRTVFVLSEIEGLTAPETAAIVDIPIGTVSSRLRRAREQFRAEAALLREELLSGEALR
jgi:RNA polymerase sigma-70 factor, ECF subfamily